MVLGDKERGIALMKSDDVYELMNKGVIGKWAYWKLKT
jgi:hypothetical protein